MVCGQCLHAQGNKIWTETRKSWCPLSCSRRTCSMFAVLWPSASWCRILQSASRERINTDGSRLPWLVVSHFQQHWHVCRGIGASAKSQVLLSWFRRSPRLWLCLFSSPSTKRLWCLIPCFRGPSAANLHSTPLPNRKSFSRWKLYLLQIQFLIVNSELHRALQLECEEFEAAWKVLVADMQRRNSPRATKIPKAPRCWLM